MGLFWCYNDNVKTIIVRGDYTMAENNEPTNQHGDPLDSGSMLLVNPGGRVVAVTREHGEQLLDSDEGFKKAPEGAREGDSIDANGEPVASQNELVPRGSSEEEAKKVAALQGTPENVRRQAAADPTNNTHVAPNQDDMDTTKNNEDPGAGEIGSSNTDNGDHPNTSGQPNSTPADESVVSGDASTGDANENGQGSATGDGAGAAAGEGDGDPSANPADPVHKGGVAAGDPTDDEGDKGQKAGRFFGRGKKNK